jgi:hypothetical protein
MPETTDGWGNYETRMDRRYCSNACRQKAYRDRKRDERYGLVQ